MKTPIIVINLKTYAEGTGKNALLIAKLTEKIAKKQKTNIAIAAQAADIRFLSENTTIPIFAQHIDGAEQGSKTGWLTAESAKEAGAVGTIINHSEHRISPEEIKKIIEISKKNGLSTIVCAKDDDEAEKLAALGPEFLAVEPPDLIGGDVSVTTRPELVKKSVERVKKINPKIKILVGAGVKTKEDVAKAIELKADGVLLASGVVKSKTPEQTIKELSEAIKKIN